MQEEQLKVVAQQLRKPEGEAGKQMGERMNRSNGLMNRYTIEQLKVQAGDRILEIGMGNGLFVKEILEKAPDVVYAGCDFSELMVEESLKQNESLVTEGQASFYLTTADKLPFEKESFNKLFTVNTLYFWEDTSKTLAEIRRVLQPGGRLVIAIRPKESMQHYPFVKWGFNLFAKAEVVEMLKEAEFKVVEVFEKEEPEQIINGESLKVEALIITAEKLG